LPSERWLNTAPCLLPFSISPSKPAAPRRIHAALCLRWRAVGPIQVQYQLLVFRTVMLVKFIRRTVPQVQNSTGPKNLNALRGGARRYHTIRSLGRSLNWFRELMVQC
jgi:hypothetical protein